jgi:hypothetical protein
MKGHFVMENRKMAKKIICVGAGAAVLLLAGTIALNGGEAISTYAETTETLPAETVPVTENSDTAEYVINTVDDELTQDAIYDRMLNTVDYFENARGSFVTDMINTQSKSTVEFVTDLNEGISYEKLSGSDNDTETLYKDGRVSTYNNTEKTVLNLICGEYEEDAEKLSGENRISTESDGSKSYYYRYNSTNLPYAKLALLPQEMTFGLLSDFSLWDLCGSTTYLGRDCEVISGTASEEYGSRLNTAEFELYVDRSTGIILKYEGFSSDGELSGYIYMQDISIDSDDSAAYSSEIDTHFKSADHDGYTDIVKESAEARQRTVSQNTDDVE